MWHAEWSSLITISLREKSVYLLFVYLICLVLFCVDIFVTNFEKRCFSSSSPAPLKSLNENVVSLENSPTLIMNELQRKYEEEGKTVYRFGFGQSPWPVPTFMVNELIKNGHQKAYLPVKGYYPLREAISNKINKQCGINSTAEDVIVSPGLCLRV